MCAKKKKKKKKHTQVPLPSEYRFRMQEDPKRNYVKHGELILCDETDKLLVFLDKPPFQLNHRVEALHHIHGRYENGTVNKVNNNRTFEIIFDKDSHRQDNTEAHDIRLLETDPKADKCKMLGKATIRGTLHPYEKHPSYQMYKNKIAQLALKKKLTHKNHTKTHFFIFFAFFF